MLPLPIKPSLACAAARSSATTAPLLPPLPTHRRLPACLAPSAKVRTRPASSIAWLVTLACSGAPHIRPDAVRFEAIASWGDRRRRFANGSTRLAAQGRPGPLLAAAGHAGVPLAARAAGAHRAGWVNTGRRAASSYPAPPGLGRDFGRGGEIRISDLVLKKYDAQRALRVRAHARLFALLHLVPHRPGARASARSKRPSSSSQLAC